MVERECEGRLEKMSVRTKETSPSYIDHGRRGVLPASSPTPRFRVLEWRPARIRTRTETSAPADPSKYNRYGPHQGCRPADVAYRTASSVVLISGTGS